MTSAGAALFFFPKTLCRLGISVGLQAQSGGRHPATSHPPMRASFECGPHCVALNIAAKANALAKSAMVSQGRIQPPKVTRHCGCDGTVAQPITYHPIDGLKARKAATAIAISRQASSRYAHRSPVLCRFIQYPQIPLPQVCTRPRGETREWRRAPWRRSRTLSPWRYP